MTFPDIDRHIKNFEFSFAKEKLLAIIQSKSNDSVLRIKAHSKLLSLYKLNSEKIESEFYENFLNLLIESDAKNLMPELIEEMSSQINSISLDAKIKLIDIYWQLGQIQDAKKLAHAISFEMIAGKRWNKITELNQVLRDKFDSFSLSLLRFIAGVETFNEADALKELSFLEHEYLKPSEKKLRPRIEKLNDIFCDFEHLPARLYLPKLRYQLLVRILHDSRPSPKELIEYILLGDTVDDDMLLYELFPQGELDHYLKNKFKKSRNRYSFFKRSLKADQNILTDIKKENEIFDISQLKLELITGEEKESSLDTKASHKLSQFEQEALYQIQGEEIDSDTKLSYVYSLLMMNLNLVALHILETMKEDTNTLYLKTEIYFRIEDYTSVIVCANQALHSVSDEEALPYLGFKARAYEKLGQADAARNVYRNIASVDPNYRFARRKL
ncbi:MAG: hypothetical protein CME62_02605 [Halobacteriovoraceae bacterium]|nr:hypothetical protein [Halobacteriovoraceae bacterium]